MTTKPDFFKDHFSKQAESYAKFRPGYPQELFSFLASSTPKHQRAWDCATGSGQAALGLTPFFDEVVATDASQSQIDKAVLHSKIKYSVSPAENSGLATGSIDLLTVASGVHWFDFDRFYKEVNRVLRPGGLIAVWVYNETQERNEIEKIISDFVKETVGSYFPEEVRRWVWSGYKTIPFPFEEVSHPEFKLSVDWKAEELLGYFSSWSAIQRYVEKNGKNPIEIIRPKILAVLGDTEKSIRRTWRLHLRIGRKVN